MKNTFIKSLVEIADKDNNVYLLTADMGFGLVEPFAERFPERFINVGVSEQNMIGVALGLSLCGKVVFVYSIANFPTMRCLEQIRTVCYHNLRVYVVSGGTGFNYGALGYSHHATEDIAIMRSLPNMTVIAPSSLKEVEQSTKAIYENMNPCYLRLGYLDKNNEFGDFKIGKATQIMKGHGVAIISTGSMLNVAIESANKLSILGIDPIVINMPTIKPIDKQILIDASKVASKFITVEEHSIIGGLGSAVAEVIAEKSLKVKLIRMGVPDSFYTKAYDRNGLLDLCSLNQDGIVKEVLCH